MSQTKINILIIIFILFTIGCNNVIDNNGDGQNYSTINQNIEIIKRYLVLPNADTTITINVELKVDKYYRIRVYQSDFGFENYFIHSRIKLADGYYAISPSREPFQVPADSTYKLEFYVREDYKSFPLNSEFTVNVFECTPFPDSLDGIWLYEKEEYHYRGFEFYLEYPKNKSAKLLDINDGIIMVYKYDSENSNGYSSYEIDFFEHDFGQHNINIYEGSRKIEFFKDCYLASEKHTLTPFSDDINSLKWTGESINYKSSKLKGTWYESRYCGFMVEIMYEEEFDGEEDTGDIFYNLNNSPTVIKVDDASIYVCNSDEYPKIDTIPFSSLEAESFFNGYLFDGTCLRSIYGGLGIYYNLIDGSYFEKQYKKYNGEFPPSGWR